MGPEPSGRGINITESGKGFEGHADCVLEFFGCEPKGQYNAWTHALIKVLTS
jgi:hypothetical protein